MVAVAVLAVVAEGIVDTEDRIVVAAAIVVVGWVVVGTLAVAMAVRIVGPMVKVAMVVDKT